MLIEQTLEKMHAMKLTAMAEAIDQQRQASQYSDLGFDERLSNPKLENQSSTIISFLLSSSSSVTNRAVGTFSYCWDYSPKRTTSHHHASRSLARPAELGPCRFRCAAS